MPSQMTRKNRVFAVRLKRFPAQAVTYGDAEWKRAS